MKTLFVLIALVLFPHVAQAQSVTLILPTSSLSFTASADHTAISLDGVTPLLTSYQVQYCTTAATPVCLTPVDIGKPTPDGTNTITVSQGLWGAIAKNLAYKATVIAFGPGGSLASAPSAPFGLPGPPAATPAPIVKR